MAHRSLGHRLPARLAAPLFGDRERFGLVPVEDDPCWLEWTERVYKQFYESTQKKSLGKTVNDAGYRVLDRVDLEGRRVLEIGPGALPHVRFWKGTPAHYAIADVREDMLEASARVLGERGVGFSSTLIAGRDASALPYAEGEFDVILSFYCLEHLHPLGDHLDRLVRCLAPGGVLAGAIPAEGGLAWGLGRFLTTRRWLRRHTTVDPDKIICWEHPNFAESILAALGSRLDRVHLGFYPLAVPLIDTNLVVRFVYRRPAPAQAASGRS